MKQIALTFVVLLLGGITFYLYKQNGELKQNIKELSEHMVSAHSNEDSLRTVIDSLTPITYNATRYEIAIERLQEKDKKAYDTFVECLRNIE